MPLRAEPVLLLMLAAAGCADPVMPPAAAAQGREPRIAYPQPDAPSAALPPEAGDSKGPTGTAGNGQPTGYDAVGLASWYGEEVAGQPTASGAPFNPDAITAAHRQLPLGSVAEVTALDTGRTILVLVTDRGPSRSDREIDLSRGAAALLGVSSTPVTAVRVRGTSAEPADLAALRSGRPASARLDTPESVLRALRKQAPRTAAAVPPAQPAAARPAPARPAPARTATSSPRPAGAATRTGASYPVPGTRVAAAPAPAQVPAPAARPAYTPTIRTPGATAAPLSAGGFVVQVAAFSGEARAIDLARRLRGSVRAGEGLYRVRLGPFADFSAAQAARDDVVRRGYGDAAIRIAD